METNSNNRNAIDFGHQYVRLLSVCELSAQRDLSPAERACVPLCAISLSRSDFFTFFRSPFARLQLPAENEKNIFFVPLRLRLSATFECRLFLSNFLHLI